LRDEKLGESCIEGVGTNLHEPRRAFGNTISYVNALGTGGAGKATVLSNTTVPSGAEFAVMTDQACDSTCGYVQPGAVA